MSQQDQEVSLPKDLLSSFSLTLWVGLCKNKWVLMRNRLLM